MPALTHDFAAPSRAAQRRQSVAVVEFNPPNLRGVSHRGPFFHDKRREAGRDFSEGPPPERTEYAADEVRDLADFLRSLYTAAIS